MSSRRLPQTLALALAVGLVAALLGSVGTAQAAASPVVGTVTAPAWVRIFSSALMTATFKLSTGEPAPAKQVTIQRLSGTTWRSIASGPTNSAGVVRFGIQWQKTGERYRVIRHGDAATLASVSNVVTSRTRAFWQRIDIGRTYRGRSVIAYQIGTPGAPHRMLVVGGLHGDEPAGIKVVQRLLTRPVAVDTDLWVIGHANPDGVAARTRGNARGVDLNRNFPRYWKPRPRGSLWSGPYAGSERETKALMAFVAKIRPQTTIVWHQQRYGGPMVDTTNGNNLTSSTISSTLHLRKVYMGRTGGHFTDWIQYRLGAGTHATTVEHALSVSTARIQLSATACLRVAALRQVAFS